MNIIETNLSFGSLSKRKSTNRIILHHAEASTCTAEDIHRWHKERGWSGAGYHFLVRKDGSKYRLRPEWAVGAHAMNNNYDSIGICAEGAFNTEIMSETQRKAISELVNYLKSKYGITKVQRHKDVMSTDCPGRNYPFEAIINDTATSNVTISNASSGYGCYGKGDKGEEVKRIQNRLIALGYSLPRYGADGSFGAETESAVKQFQSDHGLTDDGLVGPKTKTDLDNATTRTNTSFPLPSGHWYGTPSSNAKNHSGYYNTADRPAIKMIQNKIGVKADGYYGPNTKSGVESYQASNGLKKDGLAGIDTWTSMFG